MSVFKPNFKSSFKDSFKSNFKSSSGRDAILAIDNIVAFWDVSDASSVTRDGSNNTSVLADQTSNGYDFERLTNTALMPAYNLDGYLTLDGIQEYMAVPTSQALFNFMHDGTGGTVICAVNVTNEAAAGNIIGNYYTLATKGFGVNINDVAAEGRTQLFLRNGSGTSLMSFTNDGNYTAGTPAVLAYTYSDPNAELFIDGSSITTQADTGSPAAGDANYNLQLGRRGDNTLLFKGDFYGAAIFDRVLTDEEIATVSTYFAGNQ